jgi:dihydroflavonol-4-reductase
METLDPANALVTVTGASGFIALHCVRELLERGYRVRGTVRSRTSEQSLRTALLPLEPGERLSFVEANLTNDRGWQQALDGAKYVLHVASPLPKTPPKDEEELIRPAREGALRVLGAASRAGVARVVMTSSLAAIASGRKNDESHVFDERDWSDLTPDVGAYAKSKTLAERAAWDFVAKLPSERRLELVCMNPVYVLGPSLTGAENASNEIIGKLIRREVPGVPRLYFELVDVRDVATAHVLAMTNERAAGERFLLRSAAAWMKEMADTLAAAGYRVSTRVVPNFMVRLLALLDPTVRLVAKNVGKSYRVSAEKAETVLGWSGRSMKEMVLDTAASMTRQKAA